MKKNNLIHPALLRLITFLALMALAFVLFALGQIRAHGQTVQTNASGGTTTISNPVNDFTSNPTVQEGAQMIVDAFMDSTNYAVAIYGTYAPKLVSGDKYGAGALFFYNLNNYVAPAVGVDYLGHFSLLSANVTLKLPLQPFHTKTTWPALVRNLTVIPLGIVGTGKAFSGGGSGVSTLWDTGGVIQFGHLWGGKFGIGATWGAWDNAGDYSGHRYHAFLDWSKGF
jgi:hypothetical protein